MLLDNDEAFIFQRSDYNLNANNGHEKRWEKKKRKQQKKKKKKKKKRKEKKAVIGKVNSSFGWRSMSALKGISQDSIHGNFIVWNSLSLSDSKFVFKTQGKKCCFFARKNKVKLYKKKI